MRDELKEVLKKELTRVAWKQGAMYSDEGKIQVYVVASAIHDQLNTVCRELGKVVREFYQEARKTPLMREKCMTMPMREFMVWHRQFLAERFKEIYENEKTASYCSEFIANVVYDVAETFELLLGAVLLKTAKRGDENAGEENTGS